MSETTTQPTAVEPKPKVQRFNYRVIVIPELPWHDQSENAEKTAADYLLLDIKRHIDYKQAYVDYTVEKSCPHCGMVWVTPLDPESGNGCCDEHIAEWDAWRKATEK